LFAETKFLVLQGRLLTAGFTAYFFENVEDDIYEKKEKEIMHWVGWIR
jgi:hypothetical protein